jgi:predicted nucleic acid-binding Zn ribbon protein
MHCPDCGAPASEDDLFCAECGAILFAEPEVEQDTTPPLEVSPSHAPAERDSRANVAFALGLASLGLALAYCIPFISIFTCIQPLVGIPAILVGAIARRDIEARGGFETDRKRAQQGMILGIVGTALHLVLFVLGILLGIGLDAMGALD